MSMTDNEKVAEEFCRIIDEHEHLMSHNGYENEIRFIYIRCANFQKLTKAQLKIANHIISAERELIDDVVLKDISNEIHHAITQLNSWGVKLESKRTELIERYDAIKLTLGIM